MSVQGITARQARKSRLSPRPRYQIGDRIKILPDGASPFAGLEAVIQELRPNDLGVTALDRYIVLFHWGEQQTFYDVQLARVDRLVSTSRDHQ
jgi:hypothetical protein